MTGDRSVAFEIVGANQLSCSAFTDFLCIILLQSVLRIVTIETIQLHNTEFEGKNNAYLLCGDEPALIDTGVSTPTAEDALRKGLSDHGLSVAALDHIFLTHAHEDHSGLAGTFQRESGALVHTHPADASLIANDQAALEQFRERQRTLFDRWGMPTAARRELLGFFEQHDDQRGESVDPVTHTDGECVSIGNRELTVVHLPGHTAGHVGYSFEDNGTALFAGDALLPQYTPNVGGADVRVTQPLESYLSTLHRLRDAGFERAYPGHRHVIDDPEERAHEIIVHHRERSERVVEVLDNRAADAWTVSAELFGDLSGIHILHGPGEAYAHLCHLTDHGLLTETDDGVYTAEPDAKERLDAAFEDIE